MLFTATRKWPIESPSQNTLTEFGKYILNQIESRKAQLTNCPEETSGYDVIKMHKNQVERYASHNEEKAEERLQRCLIERGYYQVDGRQHDKDGNYNGNLVWEDSHR